MRAVPDAFWEATTGGKLSENVGADHGLATGQGTYFGDWQQSGQMNIDAAKNPEEFRDRMQQMQNDLLMFDEANNPEIMGPLQQNVETMYHELLPAVGDALNSDEVMARAQEMSQQPGWENVPQQDLVDMATYNLASERLSQGDLEGLPETIRPQVEEWRSLAERYNQYQGLQAASLRDAAATDPQAKGLLQYLEQARDWKTRGAFDYAQGVAEEAEQAGALGRLGMRARGSFSRSLPGTLDALAMMAMMGPAGKHSPSWMQTPFKYQAGFSAADPAFETFRWGLDEPGIQPWLNQGAEQIRMRSTYDPEASFTTRMLGELGAQQVEDPSAAAMILGGMGLRGLGKRMVGAGGAQATAGGYIGAGGQGLRELGMFQAGLRPFGAASNISQAGRRMRQGQMYTPEQLMEMQAGEQRALPFLSDALAGLMGVEKPEQGQVAATEPLTQERLALPEGVEPLAEPEQVAQERIPGVPDEAQIALTPEQMAQASPRTAPEAFGLDPAKIAEVGPDGEIAAVQATQQVLGTASKMQPDEIARLQQDAASGDPNAPGAKTAIDNIADSGGMSREEATGVWGNMDNGAKMLAGLGVALGTISLISALTSEEGGTMGFLGAVLGFGTAAGVLAHGGMFGEEAQKFTQGLMGAIGLGGPSEEESQELLADLNAGAPEALMQAEGTPEAMALPEGQGGEPAQPEAQPEQPAEPQRMSARQLHDWASQHSIPMGEGDPDTFDAPDMMNLGAGFIESGEHGEAIQALAEQMSPQEKLELKQKLHAEMTRMADPSQRSYADAAKWAVFSRNKAMQDRYRQLMGL
jgi:hypothetical protein